MGWIATLFGASSTVEKALGLADQYIEDKDKKNDLVVELVRIQAQTDAQATVPWVDALHKMGRQLMWFAVIGLYFYAKMHNVEIDLAELAMLVTGPAAYTLIKGKGQ